MLSNILLCIACLCIPVISYLSFKQGFKIGQTTTNVETKPIYKKTKKFKEQVKLDKYFDAVLKNIDMYDGTSDHQVKIKEVIR